MIGAKQGDPRVQRLLDHLGIKYRVDDDGDFRVTYELDHGRSQLGFIISDTYRLADIEIREIQSYALRSEGPFDARTANRLLRENAKMKLGAWETSESKEGIFRARFVAKVAANTDADTLSTMLRVVLRCADQIEAELVGTDDH